MQTWVEAQCDDLEHENDRLIGLLEESHALLADYADIAVTHDDVSGDYVSIVNSLIKKIEEYIEVE